ncbi:YegS/Rv2252/BmrU family lipid kinase [Emticicia sediminis]
MTTHNNLKLLFVINAASGNNSIDWTSEITNYFATTNHTIDFYHLTKNCNISTIKAQIKAFSPYCVVAVGGDGTIKLVAECLMKTKILLGILPSGSANGLAKELGISDIPTQALDILTQGYSKKIHITQINEQLCIHLSDIGLNAYVVKEFENQPMRGWWGYLLAALKVLWQNPLMDITIKINEKSVKMKAEMIVIANATKYGNGVVINPIGKLDDKFFEVIVIKKKSFYEIFKMTFAYGSHDTDKTEIFQTDTLYMKSRKQVHFQIDGEYLGKVKEVHAVIAPNALQVIVPNV